ncbi:MAG: hypothetical protein CGU29_04385 [Candidatus Dactylopiibacterium carminicum]|uniref:Uncharacterized protein n=1 Tax=Candidatus Dactylopiibacterium carminicum TaxID=857335 RepID=A0A272EW89_9RHOO|nr:hypothetical protein [Candidatus Dactylopiibacterium carminicum]KAF7599632.1 hypothetical protein BGI27_07015 [Candidatus Dactylopiibacterium carminicum]PAS94326.1 MAG: hypothetical protein CGU29_04385 [Candidatus Dactylopiibacterium carminicum]PAS99633.1 MAG: hypothetical protein BSR46_07055 [Candidatus Dactylopiibacterium carminicum]
MSIRQYLGNQILGVLAHYAPRGVSVQICGVYPEWDNSLQVFFPKGHALRVGDFATLHLDNRSGVDEYDDELKVYRGSYKGVVTGVRGDWAVLQPRECTLYHGLRAVLTLRTPGYDFPADARPSQSLAQTTLRHLPSANGDDHENKVGVLVTMAPEQPHTTVLAFLSSTQDDVFLITFPDTFKSRLLKRDPRCFFVIDERASFTFERRIEWNYTILAGVAASIPRGALYEEVRESFIRKNPWEIGFFVREDLEMYHISRQRILAPGEAYVPTLG